MSRDPMSVTSDSDTSKPDTSNSDVEVRHG